MLPGSGVNTSYHVYQEYPTDNIIKFLFIARLLKDKGTEEYFETAKIIKEKYPNTEFQILGYCDDGKYQTQLDELTKAGVINFWGVPLMYAHILVTYIAQLCHLITRGFLM